jgi:hypothetical protein
MAAMTPLFINLSLWMSADDVGGAAGAVAMTTAAGKKQQKEAPGSHKISNNFKLVGRQNLPCVAKAGDGMSKPEAVGSMPRKGPQEGTPQKKLRGKDTFVFRVDRERAKAAKIVMLDVAHVDLPVAVRGAKREDAGDLANQTKQVGHSPPETMARGFCTKGGRRTPINKGGSNEENFKIARSKIMAYGQVGEGRQRETASMTMGPAPNLGHGHKMATPTNAVAWAAAETTPAVLTETAVGSA